MPDSYDFANPIQERVYRRLRLLVGAGPAAFFRDACSLMDDPSRLAATTHVIGHLLREIEGNLLDVLYGQLVAPPPTVTSAPPPDLVQPKSPTPTPPPNEVEAASDGAGAAAGGAAAGEAKKDGHRKKVQAILTALGIPEDADVARQWMSMAGGEKGLHRVAHRDKLNEPRLVTPTFLAEFSAIIELFDAILERFEARYGSVYERLDALLARPEPGPDGIRLLGEAVPNTPRTLSYFFERLTHVGWLEPLQRAGFFRAPLPESDPIRGTIGYPYWTAADYLTRVAAARPFDVGSVLEGAADTENVRAQSQMIAVTLQLRPEERLRLAGVVKRWVPGLRRLLWGDQVPAFVIALARDGARDLAFGLAADVLDLPEADSKSGRRQALEARYGREQHDRAWDLREAATTLVPTLLQADGLRALALFADALDHHAGRRPHEAEADPTTPAGLEDFSHHWANDLGRRERHDTGDLRLLLVHITLEAVQEMGASVPDQLGDILHLLQRRGARVLRRIELAALTALIQSDDARVSSAALPIAADRLAERALVQEDDVAPEWGALLTAVFPRLDAGGRARVLAALEPPDFSWMDQEHAAIRVAVWRRDRLAVVADHLDSSGKWELAALVGAHGDAEPLRHGGPRIATFVGPASPIDSAALQAMDVERLVAFLREWEPRPGFAEASPEGLGRQLAKMIEEDPARYAPWATHFIGLEPTYVRSFLGGFAGASRADRAFPWTDVLGLAQWVVDQPAPAFDMGESQGGPAVDADADWRGARRTLADLLGLGLGRGWDAEGSVPLPERGRLWGLIERLAEDPNPSPAYEESYGGRNMDPFTMAINTTRPEAIDAAIRYALWVASHTAQSSADLRAVLLTAPEVAGLLERHLNPTIDPSLATRAAIGHWLGTLARTDPEWVRGHLELLLPDDATGRAGRDALWDAYVQFSQPHPDAVPVLDAYYRAALERTGADRGTRHIGNGPDDRLAEHIMELYWWGAVPLEEQTSLVPYLFGHADAARRKHAIHFAGFSLFHTEKPVAGEPIERLRRLWEWRVPQLEAVIVAPGQRDGEDARAARVELEEFGWWFASGAFDPVWALAQLEKVLALAGGVELDHAVAEHLEELSTNHPAAALRCLSAVDFIGDGQHWSVHSWLEPAHTILQGVLEHGSDTVRQEARALVNRIVAAGHLEFRPLLDA